jgi:hypothetical protein
MKIRFGCISNSSSSSFIIGLAKVKNMKKLREYISKLQIDGTVFIDHIGNIKKQIKNDKYEMWGISVDDHYVNVTADVNSDPCISLPYKTDNDKVLIVKIGNDEGDSPFWNNYTEEYEYDIDDTYFHGDQSKILNLLMSDNELIKDSKYLYGAERNG